MVNTWDAVGRKRVYQVWTIMPVGKNDGHVLPTNSTLFLFSRAQFHKYPTSIAALDFNQDGSLLAIASSYTMEDGDREYVCGGS